MSKPKDAKTRKQAQRSRDAALGIQRVEVRLSIREREKLETLRCARAGSGEPYSADEYISTLLRRDWEWWVSQEDNLKMQVCKHCNCQLPTGCNGAFKGETTCWQTAGDKTLAL
ncbi:hypothetical protein [Aeromonas salmonicida]|uniref:hypothetical protein n=1 Tax=Aeromonas salmonicida TaxID=645 RepID=UPI001C631EC4|nr:hypothetical protein [Aeromonas salmonicida]QYH27413.1 hypothetical protein G9H43_18715 [Aeromonas salmonicida subsp. masoucida]QYH31702.1 hypothetical protein G9457_18835 [Aeromonas salmonicida subsp. masoucida]